MTKDELANLLNGHEIGNEISDELEAVAKQAGLIVAFGESDDLLEFRGAIHDEVGAYEGTTALFADGRVFDDQACNDECKYFIAARALAEQSGKSVRAVWCPEETYSWAIETDLPHATFCIWEDGEKYCRGIVFELKDIQ
jgi:hypothetical protein